MLFKFKDLKYSLIMFINQSFYKSIILSFNYFCRELQYFFVFAIHEFAQAVPVTPATDYSIVTELFIKIRTYWHEKKT